MATRKVVTGAWSLRYFAQKLQLGVQETLGQLPNSGGASAAIAKGLDAFKAPVSSIFYLTGAAMVITQDLLQPLVGIAARDSSFALIARGAGCA